MSLYSYFSLFGTFFCSWFYQRHYLFQTWISSAPSGLGQGSSDPLSKSGPCATLCNTPLHHIPCGDNYMYTYCLLHQTSLFSKSKAMFYSSLCPYCLQESPWLGDFGLVWKLTRSLISSGSVIQYYPRLSIFVVPI